MEERGTFETLIKVCQNSPSTHQTLNLEDLYFGVVVFILKDCWEDKHAILCDNCKHS